MICQAMRRHGRTLNTFNEGQRGHRQCESNSVMFWEMQNYGDRRILSGGPWGKGGMNHQSIEDFRTKNILRMML